MNMTDAHHTIANNGASCTAWHDMTLFTAKRQHQIRLLMARHVFIKHSNCTF